MSSASFRQLTQINGLKVGFYIGEFITPGIGQIIHAAGCEFAMLDMEHSGFGYETVKSTLRCLHDAGVASILRPPSQAYHHVARACDGRMVCLPTQLHATTSGVRCWPKKVYAVNAPDSQPLIASPSVAPASPR